MIAEILSRLEANQVALGLSLIGSAAAFQTAAETNPLATPAAYLLPLEESPRENEWEGAVIQEVVETFAVILVVRNASDALGAAAQVDLQALRKAVRSLLYGWAPSERQPLQRGPGRLLAFQDGHMWWQDIYFTSYYDRSVQ